MTGRARVLGLAAGAAVLVAVSGLVVVAALPTGASSAAAVVADGLRIAATASVDDAEVLVATDGRQPRAVLAYRGPKGWLGAELGRAPRGAAAAWATTEGEGPVPAVSVVFGRADGDRVEVRWVDGTTTTAVPSADGHYVAVREGSDAPATVTVRRGGEVVDEVAFR